VLTIISGMRVEFLLPYSPDFNPIELAFSAIKHDIRRNGGLIRKAMDSEGSKAEVLSELWDAVWSVTPDDAEGWYYHCGYS
jgi:transposase